MVGGKELDEGAARERRLSRRGMTAWRPGVRKCAQSKSAPMCKVMKVSANVGYSSGKIDAAKPKKLETHTFSAFLHNIC